MKFCECKDSRKCPLCDKTEPYEKTLRDEFAMAALTGIVNCGQWNEDDSLSLMYPEEAAVSSYEYADAMLKARKLSKEK